MLNFRILRLLVLPSALMVGCSEPCEYPCLQFDIVRHCESGDRCKLNGETWGSCENLTTGCPPGLQQNSGTFELEVPLEPLRDNLAESPDLRVNVANQIELAAEFDDVPADCDAFRNISYSFLECSVPEGAELMRIKSTEAPGRVYITLLNKECEAKHDLCPL